MSRRIAITLLAAAAWGRPPGLRGSPWTRVPLALQPAAVFDRVAVIVGKHVIKTSDIDRELRVSAFLNRQPWDGSSIAMRRAADRLVDQELVRQDLLNGHYAQPTEKDVAAFLDELKRDRFGGNGSRFQSELARFHLTEDQLRHHLLWQLTVLRFIDQRFRPGVLVTDEDVATYYQQHRAALQKENPRNNSLETLSPVIRETIAGERINQAFEEWLVETRRGMRIDFREHAFLGGTTQ
jgi:hypothetical protein